jgi:hypothetical protein
MLKSAINIQALHGSPAARYEPVHAPIERWMTMGRWEESNSVIVFGRLLVSTVLRIDKSVAWSAV